MITIKNYIMAVYNDFREYIEQNDNLCILKTLNYQAGQRPNYLDIHIQQLYLLRYVFSYAFEYKSIYNSLLEKEEFKDNIMVVSIGCGNMIDYWGLVEVLNEIENEKCTIIYKGIDTIDWNYKIKARKSDNIKFINANAAEIFTKAKRLVSDIYIFPKSISEFLENEFQSICESFSKKKIEKDRIHILITLRSDSGSMDRDMERSERIIKAIEQNGFITKNKATEYIHYRNENRGIKKIDYRFEYPNEAIELLTSLNIKCGTFINNGENCRSDCKSLNRWPVLKAKNIRYQVLTFDRKDSL